MADDVVLLPAQAARVSREASVTGAAVGISHAGGSTIIVNTGRKTIRIGAGGQDLPDPDQETLC